ncbi:phage holin family protein [Candidatus Wolfebacteria bacterium]|nr:phage holin family protein [Candidatus Wolfebacteria bacterium]
MFKFIAKIIFSFVSNIIALGAAAYFIREFYISPDFVKFLAVAAIFTAINIFIKPVLKMVLSPVIFLTLGFGIIIVNMITLYILDKFSADINISGTMPLLYATLIIGAVNLIVHFSAKKLYQE